MTDKIEVTQARIVQIINDHMKFGEHGITVDVEGASSKIIQSTAALQAESFDQRYTEPSAQAAAAFQTDPEYEADEDGNPLWKCEVQSDGGHAIVAEVYGESQAEAEARGLAIASALSGQSTAALQAEVDALRAKLDEQWQPIETAPKDGTYIIIAAFHDNGLGEVYCYGGTPNIAMWSPTQKRQIGTGLKVDWLTPYTRLISEGHGSPTHWMPLADMPRIDALLETRQ